MTKKTHSKIKTRKRTGKNNDSYNKKYGEKNDKEKGRIWVNHQRLSILANSKFLCLPSSSLLRIVLSDPNKRRLELMMRRAKASCIELTY